MSRLLVVFFALFLFACGGDDPPSVNPPLECEPGYRAMGTTCVDIDECETDNPCEDGQSCVNEDGTYRCESAADPCAAKPCGDGTCVPGSSSGYMCSCPQGQSFGDGTCVPDESPDECANGTATCSEFATCFNTVDGYDCICDTGYQGDGVACVDQDGCAGDPCFEDVTCTDVPAPGVGFECGACPEGLEGDGINCTPSQCPPDTCFEGVTCTSPAPGTYECGACPSGYEGDGVTCSPIDACLGNPCFASVTCTNTGPGTYTCGACPSGYTGDGESCSDVDECATNPCDTNATCSNFPGSFSCVCDSGYVGDGFVCNVPSACDPATSGTCHANAECADSDADGTYNCICNPGYEGDGTTCADINECTRNTDNCSANATCANTTGSFTCSCNAGFEGDGTVCQDIDGCTTNPCFTGVICTDVAAPGTGFTCGACPAGYEGDGITCTDINGCANNPCFANVTCSDITAPGSGFSCGSCPAGYEGDGITCTDINGCANNPCFPSVTCSDTPAPGTGFSCGACPAGYEGNGITCNATNVCATNPCALGVTCTNNPSAPGGFTCGACPAGFEGDGVTCTDIDGCANNPCFVGVTCFDNPAPLTGFYCDLCPAGYTGDGINCVELPTSCNPNPCYTGVDCNDDGNGNYTCDACPAGMFGDGQICQFRIFEIPGSGGTSGGYGNYNSGATVSMTATPFPGYSFDGWANSSGTILSTQNPWVFQATESLSLQAVFSLDTYTITVNPSTDGTTTGSGQFQSGNTVVIQATPNQYYTFQYWTDELGNQITNNPYGFLPTQDKTFTATFAYTPPPSYTVLLSASPAGSATVSQSGNGTYFQGTSVTVTAVPAPGYVFVRWRGQDFAQYSTDPSYTFSISRNLDLVAEMKREFQVTTNKVFKRNTEFISTNNGTVTGGGTYLEGQTAQLQAVAPAGAKFWRWVDQNNTLITAQNPVSVTVNSNLTYRAVFVAFTQHVATTGNDTTGRGTTNLPWRTPQAAMAFLSNHSAVDGGEVRVQAGSYDVDPLAPIVVTGGMKLLGGYDTTWNRLYRTAANRNNASYKTELRSTQTSNLATPIPTVTVRLKGASGQMSLVQGFNIYGGQLGVTSTKAVQVISAELAYNTLFGGEGTTSQIGVEFGGVAVVQNNAVYGRTGIICAGFPSGSNVFENDVYGGGITTGFPSSTNNPEAQIHSNRLRPDPVTNQSRGFSYRGGGDLNFFDNTFFAGTATSTSLQASVWVEAFNTDPANVDISGNTIVGVMGRNVAGIRVSGTSSLARVNINNNTIFGGLTNEIGGEATGVLIEGPQLLAIMNNTIDTGRLTGPHGARKLCGVTMQSNAALRNNIIFSSTNIAAQGTVSSTNYVTGLCTNNYTPLTVQHNLFWPEQLNFLRPATSPFTIVAFNGTGSYAGNVVVDPVLVNASALENAGGNWRLSATSPDVAKYGGKVNGLTDDKAGAPRTTGGPTPGNGGDGWSIGAYEY